MYEDRSISQLSSHQQSHGRGGDDRQEEDDDIQEEDDDIQGFHHRPTKYSRSTIVDKHTSAIQTKGIPTEIG